MVPVGFVIRVRVLNNLCIGYSTYYGGAGGRGIPCTCLIDRGGGGAQPLTTYLNRRP